MLTFGIHYPVDFQIQWPCINEKKQKKKKGYKNSGLVCLTRCEVSCYSLEI